MQSIFSIGHVKKRTLKNKNYKHKYYKIKFTIMKSEHTKGNTENSFYIKGNKHIKKLIY